MRRALLTAFVATSLLLAAAPAQAGEVAGARVEGACYADGEGAQDELSVSVSADRIVVDLPSPANAFDAATACTQVPEGGSYAAVGAEAGDRGERVSTTDDASVTVEGACYDGNDGAQEEVAVADPDDPTVSEPEAGNVQDGAAACASAASKGETPSSGSHLTVDATREDDSVSASTTDDASVTVEGACYHGDDGARDDVRVADPDDPEAETASRSNVESGAAACADAASDGERPSSGSHAGVTVAYEDTSESASTADEAEVVAEGACKYDGGGGADEARLAAGDDGVAFDDPDTQEARFAFFACTFALLDGETPDGGSYAAVTVSASGQAVGVSTVPATDGAPLP